MFVRWRTLIGFAVIFWVCICFYDAYFFNPATKSYYSSTNEFDWLAQVSTEEILQESGDSTRADDIKFPYESENLGVSLLLWNIFTFFATITLCTIGKFVLTHMGYFQEKFSNFRMRRVENQEQPPLDAKGKRSVNSSKIPVATKSTSTSYDEVTRSKSRDKLFDSCASLLSTSSVSLDVAVRSSKSEMSSRIEMQMEKQCAKLRDDMIALQTNSLKEHAALSRKLESVCREKKELYRQLLTSQKENRVAKQQLDELLAEKALLVKRLDCASREFKTNTNSKKSALAKLEESQSTIKALKQQVDRVSREKEQLESKFKSLDADYRHLKKRLTKLESTYTQTPEGTTKSINVECDSTEANSNVPEKDVKRSDFSEITQSQKDVQRVQMRLANLEKSLDRLKLINWDKKEEQQKKPPTPRLISTEKEEDQTDSDSVSLLTAHISSTQAAPLVEGQQNVKTILDHNDNLTDEQRRKIIDPMDSSGDEVSCTSKNLDSFIECTGDDPFERVGSLLSYVKHSSSLSSRKNTRFDSDFVKDIPHVVDASPFEEEESDDMESSKGRMVSNSLAFRQFLKNLDPLERPKKFPAVTHIIF